MTDEPIVDRDDAHAALAARQELGEDLEPQVVDAFVERVEKRLEQRVRAETVRREPTERQRMSLLVALVSLGCGIPITAIALGAGGLPALAIAWAGIVLLNLFFARSR